jgi:TonB family protein
MVHSHNFKPEVRDRVDAAGGLFRSLEFKESRQRSVFMSVVVHGVLLTVLLVIPLLFTDAIKIRYDIALIAPPPPRPKPILEVTPYRAPRKPEPKPEKPLVSPPPEKPPIIQPPPPRLPEPPKIPEVKPPEKPAPILRNTPRLEEAPPAPAPPKMEVRTGVFSAESPKPTTNAPAAQVQTGGFGDPNGIKGEGKTGKAGNIASLGSFDLPTGAGAGNGTGGANGTKGVVANTGFGSGAAAAGASGNSNRVVRAGGFGDAEAAKAEGPKKRDTGPPQTPVEVLFKPKPDYTDEARKLKLEGEVLVRILFTAGGEVRVLDVVRGLGHGLDESALRAAQQIKFKPAQRDGQPVDSTATVHILFQLAY